jgi:hypothetical protein
MLNPQSEIITSLTPAHPHSKVLHTIQRMWHEDILDATEWTKLNETLLDIRNHRLRRAAKAA